MGVKQINWVNPWTEKEVDGTHLIGGKPYVEKGKFNNLPDFYNKMYIDKHFNRIVDFIDYPAIVFKLDGDIQTLITHKGKDNQMVSLKDTGNIIMTNYVTEIYKTKNPVMIDLFEKYAKNHNLNFIKLGNYYKTY